MVPIYTDHSKKKRTKLFLKKPTGQLMTLILQTPIFFKIELKFVCSFSNSFTLQTSEPDRRSCWRWIALASRIFHKFCRKIVVYVKIQRSYKRFVKNLSVNVSLSSRQVRFVFWIVSTHACLWTVCLSLSTCTVTLYCCFWLFFAAWS